MTRGIGSYSHWVTLATAFIAIGCQSGGVGDPCIPEAEYSLYFNNFSQDDVFVETRSFQCETRLCLVNHFQGRVSCPYGQTQAELTQQAAATSPDLKRVCKIPGTTGKVPPANSNQLISSDVVQVAVKPQYVRRSPDDAVYCSCRCKNDKGATDDGANYCDCPSGFSCEKLQADYDLGKPELAGYYCIKAGTRYDANLTTTCDIEHPSAECDKHIRQ